MRELFARRSGTRGYFPNERVALKTLNVLRCSLDPKGFDNALTETVNGVYKTELVYGPARGGPKKIVEGLKLATFGWVHWHNSSRLHSYLVDLPPTEFEATFYDARQTDQTQSKSNSPSLHRNQCYSG